METVYIETTFISYLVARPSRDLVVAAHQQITNEWWSERRSDFECYVSQMVIDEASAGDPEEVRKRIDIINDLLVLEAAQEAEDLTNTLLAKRIVPPKAVGDAVHISIATVNEIDFMLTWNCKHLANAQIMRRISAVCQSAGYRMPLICTPEELMGGQDDAG